MSIAARSTGHRQALFERVPLTAILRDPGPQRSGSPIPVELEHLARVVAR